MKFRNYLALALASALPLTANAQEQLKHEKKVYVNKENRVYVNKTLPIYFRVSTSPDISSESYNLPSEQSVKYANPMYFDTEGRNTLRSPSAVDPKTKQIVMPKQDVLFEIYADGMAPLTKFNSKGAQSVVSRGKTYYGKSFLPELKSVDETSGTETVYVSVNQQPYAAYDPKTFLFDTEKEYSIKYYGVDYVGNVEAPKIVTFNIDISAPITTYAIVGDKKGKVLSSKASIKLTASDTLSGVDKILYAINDGKVMPYTTPIPVSVLNKEDSKITYYAVDKLGNKEEAKVISTFSGMTSENMDASAYGYYIDKEPPVISMDIEGDKYKSNAMYVSERSRIKINASDDKSGVEKVMYSVDNLTLNQSYADPFPVQKEGKHLIAFAASDYVGNLALAKTQQILLDATAPVSKLSLIGPMFVNRDTTFINSKTQFSIQVTEAGSGIQSVNYAFDNGQTAKYASPFTATAEGFHALQYNAVDQVNNSEAMKEKTFFVDNTAPVIHFNFSVKAIGEKQVRDEKYVIYPSNVMLYIAATDNASGGEKIEYTINGKRVPVSTIPVKGLAPGNYEIEVTASDVLKNTSKETIKFSVED
jgi:hypothetical protein